MIVGTAKAALDKFVRCVALELAPYGITANLVAPATVDETKITEQLTAARSTTSAPPTPWAPGPSRRGRTTIAFLTSVSLRVHRRSLPPRQRRPLHGLSTAEPQSKRSSDARDRPGLRRP